MSLQLDTSQVSALGKSKERFDAGVNRQLIVAATGWGKTATFANIPRMLGLTGRGMILTHREKLAFQTADSVREWNPEIMVGVEMAQHRAGAMCNIVVGSVPTLGKSHSRRLAQFDPSQFDWVAPDEAHHSTAPEWRRCLAHFGLDRPNQSPILSLGFTATPNRSDGAGLSLDFDEIVFEYPITRGIQDGILVDIRGVRIDTSVDLNGVKWSKGQFNDAELTKEINTDRRNGIIVKAWMQHALDLRTMVFTQNIQHAVDLAAVFQKCGIGAQAVWGDDPQESKKIAGHKAGEFPVLLNAQLTIEGYDDPEIRCVILGTPDGSQLRYAQKIGRLTRIESIIRRLFGNLHNARAAGHPIKKEWGLVMDVCDNCDKHSLQTLPSLLGMPKDLDLKGSSAMKAKDQFERVAREFPTADVSKVVSLAQLDSMAENISLFKVSYPPEIKQLSELAWRASGDGYMLAVNRELVTLTKDLRDEWWVKGNLGGKQQEVHLQNLAGAFNAADRIVSNTVGSGKLGMLMRDVRWRNDPPTTGQVALCKKLGLSIPQGATKGMVSAAIDARLGSKAPPTRKPIDDEYHGEF